MTLMQTRSFLTSRLGAAHHWITRQCRWRDDVADDDVVDDMAGAKDDADAGDSADADDANGDGLSLLMKLKEMSTSTMGVTTTMT